MSSKPAKDMQCADVRTIGNAHSHNTPKGDTTPRTLPAHTGLKALAGAVLARTLPRTLPAQSEETARTLPAQRDAALQASTHALTAADASASELARLVRLCGEHYAFTDDEHESALQIALADPVSALTCFRAMARTLPEPSAAPAGDGSLTTAGKEKRHA